MELYHFRSLLNHVFLISFSVTFGVFYDFLIFTVFVYSQDDGALSWTEFKSFFSDGVSSNEDLERLFKEIDTHETK